MRALLTTRSLIAEKGSVPIIPIIPVIGICGYSGAGKTTLIEALVPLLLQRGLAVAVVKHDAHQLTLDREGKDTDRFFRAGATVLAHDAQQVFLRRAKTDADPEIGAAIRLLATDHDVILVEGHKATPLPAKLWLERGGSDGPPAEVGPVLASLPLDGGRVERALPLIEDSVRDQFLRRPVRAGLLIGGASARMGRPKHLLPYGDRTWVEHIADAVRPNVDGVCIVGAGGLPPSLADCPGLLDVPGIAGPAGGMLAAMRWDPHASWLFIACDMPRVTPEAVQWLLGQREPGRWAVIPRTPDGQAQPLLAWYDPRISPALEQAGRPMALVDHPKTVTPLIPEPLSDAWWNANAPEDLHSPPAPSPPGG